MRILLRSLILVLVTWLFAANALLNIKAAHGLFSPTPDRFEIRWQRAFSPLPGVVWAQGVEINIATERVVAWFAADRVLAVFEPWALATRTFRTRTLRVSGLEVRSRPQPGTSPIWDRLAAHLPEIPHRETAVAATDPPPASGPALDRPADARPDRLPDRQRWLLQLNGVRADGVRAAHLHALSMGFEGSLRADVHLRVRDTLQVPALRADGVLLEVHLSGGAIARQLAVRARASIAPYVPREHRGRRMVRFISGDAEVAGDIESLRAINFYFGPDSDLRVDGQGRAEIGLRMIDGAIAPGSRGRIEDAQLDARWHGWHIAGGGDIEVVADADGDGDGHRLVATMEGATLRHGDDAGVLIDSGQLHAVQHASRLLLTERTGDERVAVRMEQARIPDLSLLDRYLPVELGIRLEPGPARGALRWEIDPERIRAQADLDAEGVVGAIDDHPVQADVQARMVLDIDRTSGRIDASGSVVRIDNGRPAGDSDAPPLQARLELTRVLVHRRADESEAALLGLADGQLTIAGEISDIGFLNVLVPGPQDLRWRGTAELDADIALADGRMLADSTLRLAVPDLSIGFLDFRAGGQGEIVAWLEGDSQGGRLHLTGALTDVVIASSGVVEPHVTAERLDVAATGRVERIARGVSNGEVSIVVTSATIPDLSTYNRYLPESVGVTLIGGRGRFTMQLLLADSDSHGQITLDAPNADVRIYEQRVTGHLNADIRLSRGQIRERLFDLDGSRVVLNNVAVDGSDGQWWAEADVDHGQVLWREPLRVSARLRTRMRDSVPLVHLFLDDRLRFEWMKRLLETPDIAGYTTLGIDGDGIVFNDADVRSADFHVNAHLRLGRERPPQGMLLLGHGNLAVAVELRDGERDWSLRQARQRFESYPAFPLPPLR